MSALTLTEGQIRPSSEVLEVRISNYQFEDTTELITAMFYTW